MTDRGAEIARVALLDEPVRRELFEYVRGRGEAVGRDEAAGAVGVARGLAAFHLDRLARAGLLDVEYRRLTGRTGRGAGRPAKLYRPGAARVSVTVPETRYELAGTVLVRALDWAGRRAGGARTAAVRRAAEESGLELGRALAPTVGRGPATRRTLRALDGLGFEPTARRGTIRLGNCPFHALVEQNAELVCAMNHALIGGLVKGLGAGELIAEADPEPGACCVRVRSEGA